jgi:hypothetical protein
MNLKNESEIDFAEIDEPTLAIQGVKNLRDRFKRLRQGAITDIRERDNLPQDAKIPYQGEFLLYFSSFSFPPELIPFCCPFRFQSSWIIYLLYTLNRVKLTRGFIVQQRRNVY